jgi:hypothetical protein
MGLPDPAAVRIDVVAMPGTGKARLTGVIKNIGKRVSKNGRARLLVTRGNGGAPPKKLCDKTYANLQPGIEFALTCDVWLSDLQEDPFSTSISLETVAAGVSAGIQAGRNPYGQPTPTPPTPPTFGHITLLIEPVSQRIALDDAILTNNQATKAGSEIMALFPH